MSEATTNQAVKVATVQAEPCWFDIESGVKKTVNLILEASKNGAKLVAFPELWLPGYPNFIHALPPPVSTDLMLRYFQNSLEVNSQYMIDIRKAARDASIMVVLGSSERDGGSLYMAQTFIAADGSIDLHRRKFKPTAHERIIFGDASGDCSRNVVQTPIGKIGGLQCFEHHQPLLKYNTYFQGEQIHIASWPNLFQHIGDMPWFNAVDSCRGATHQYAVESGAFVLLASHTQSESGIEANGMSIETQPGVIQPHTALVGGGFSEIVAPDGRSLTKPVPADWEGLIYADLDFNEIYKAKSIVDPVGQYSRPDIFTLQVRNRVRRHCEISGVDDTYMHAARFQDLDNASCASSPLVSAQIVD